MTVPVTAARQATFCTDPADSVSEKSIKRGNIELPIIEDLHTESGVRQIGITPSSERSSPIYGSKSALQRFKDECKRTRLKPLSFVDDSSELDILSDVGIAGDDSDSDVVPSLSSSLSAKTKVRKEPRIKVPHSKVDNAEPTIQEETTQEIIDTNAPIKDTTRILNKNRIQPQIRSGTVVVNKKSENAITKANKDAKENVVDNQKKVYEKDVPKQTTSHDKADKDHIQPILPNPTIGNEPESSFCESDWQPKKKDRLTDLSTNPRIKNGTSSVICEDKNVIASKYDSQIKPTLKATPAETQRKRPRSSGDENKPRKEKRSVNRRISEHNNPINNITFEKTDKSVTGISAKSRPKSTDVPPSHTPLISEFCSGRDDLPPPKGGNWIEKNERVSGIPKRGIPTKATPRKEPLTEYLQPKPPDVADTPDKMATSDGYDYESETFEEILQERNAMVKAERTYQRRIRQLEEELKGMITQCQALSDENKELRKTIDSLKKDEAPTKPEEKDDTVELASRIARLETEKENLVKENERMSLALKENDNRKKQTDTIFVENTKLKSKNSELEKRVTASEKELESLSNKMKEVNSDNTGKASVMEFKYKEMEVAVAELKHENKNLTVKASSLEKDKKFLTTALEEKRIELNEVVRAMQNETTTESDLRYSKEKLDNAQEEIISVRQELDDMKRTLLESEANKDKLRSVIALRDAELKRARNDQEHKNKVMVDQRLSLDKAKQEIERYQQSESQSKDLEKETNALKSRIGSLKAEIESSLQENQRLKREREEVNFELNRLRNENMAATEAVGESRRYFRKWEVERDARNKAEVDLAKKQEEVEALDARAKDSGNKINVLYTRLRALEDDRTRYKGPNAQELETNNKVLRDENKKLRQMLVERNIELTNKNNEKEAMDSRIDLLEKKQKDAEVRVRQISSWVSSADGDSQSSARDGSNSNRAPNKEHLPPRHSKAIPSKSSSRHQSQTSNSIASNNRQRFAEPQIAFVSPRSRKKGVKRNAHPSMTPPPGWERPSYDRDSDHANHNHTPLSLPVIDSKSSTPPDPNGGYFQMYQDKLKRMKERRF